MKLYLDSETIELNPEATKNFEACCSEVMKLLLSRKRSIGSCAIDGKLYANMPDAVEAFNRADAVTFTSIPLKTAIIAMADQNNSELEVVEELCEALVTDSLLAEPNEIVRQWSSLCDKIKERISHLSSLAMVSGEEKMNELIDVHYIHLNQIMKTLGEVFSKADVVGFSDALETQLLPWIKEMREFSLSLSNNIKTVNA